MNNQIVLSFSELIKQYYELSIYPQGEIHSIKATFYLVNQSNLENIVASSVYEIAQINRTFLHSVMRFIKQISNNHAGCLIWVYNRINFCLIKYGAAGQFEMTHSTTCERLMDRVYLN